MMVSVWFGIGRSSQQPTVQKKGTKQGQSAESVVLPPPSVSRGEE